MEGNSLLITLTKNLSDEVNRFRRINVKKLISMKDLLNKPINQAKFILNDISSLRELSENLINKDGNSNVEINIKNSDKKLVFRLKNKRKIDRKSINLIKNNNISSVIN